MLPLDARVVRRGACVCRVFMSGIDFFARKMLVGSVCELEGERYAEGARDKVGGWVR